MKKIFIYIFVVFQMTTLNAYAIQDNVIKPDLVSKITYNEVWKQAKEHAYDLKISNYETLIAKSKIIGARSDYLPKLMFMAGTEYTKNFRDGRDTTVMSIGDAYINPYTRYQSVLGITLSYNLFDFGLRRANLNKANLDMIKTLYNAGQVNKTDVNDREVKVQKVEKHIAELSPMLAESVNWLSFYTGQEYDLDNISVGMLPNPNFDPMESIDYTKTITWKYYDSEIKTKEFEVQAVKRANLPKVNVYSKYYMYGSDRDSYGESLKDIKSSNWAIGGNITMPLFDGLKNYGDIKRVSLELEQMLIKRDKAIAEWMTRLASMRSNLMYLRDQSDAASNIICELKDKDKAKKKIII